MKNKKFSILFYLLFIFVQFQSNNNNIDHIDVSSIQFYYMAPTYI